jgi:hypothetical protein
MLVFSSDKLQLDSEHSMAAAVLIMLQNGMLTPGAVLDALVICIRGEHIRSSAVTALLPPLNVCLPARYRRGRPDDPMRIFKIDADFWGDSGPSVALDGEVIIDVLVVTTQDYMKRISIDITNVTFDDKAIKFIMYIIAFDHEYTEIARIERLEVTLMMKKMSINIDTGPHRTRVFKGCSVHIYTQRI